MQSISSGGNSGQQGLIHRAMQRYSRLLNSRPLLTKSATGGVLNAIGDSLSQLVIEKSGMHGFNRKRTVVFVLTGALLISPALHLWFSTLDRVVTLPGFAGASLKLAADQLVWAPCFVAAILSAYVWLLCFRVSTVLALLCAPLYNFLLRILFPYCPIDNGSFDCIATPRVLTLEGRPNEVPAKLRSDWVGVVQSNWHLWIPVQLLNFTAVPANLRVLVTNLVAVGWNAYLSYASHKKTH